MATQLTISGVTDELRRRLRTLARRKGLSVNTVALGLLEDAVGDERRRRRLERYVTWSMADLRECDAEVMNQRVHRE